MLFNSLDFFIFFPIVTTLYFLLPHKFRWMLLLAASCYFYMSFIPVYILILALTISVDYFAAIEIEKSEGRRKKRFFVLSILSTCLILFVFKYFNFFNSNFEALAHFLHWNYPIKALAIILPLGLSFHTFQSLSYVIEVYRGHQKAERNFGIYSLYVMFYPQLVAGPIERPQNLLHQFREKHNFDYQRVKSGLFLMLWGLFKKVVLADRLSIYVNEVFNNPGKYHGLPVVFAVVFFAFQIYFDFSGYSDMAIGAAKVMGFDLMLNFKRPYASKSIAEFWGRWHISLSTWFKDYVYIPLGGSRVPVPRVVLNLLIVFIVSGLWHGAGWTFVIWGALHGIIRAGEYLTVKTRKKISETMPIALFSALGFVCTFITVCFAWIFFRASSFLQAMQIIKSIGEHGSISSALNVMYSPFLILLLISLLALTLFFEYKGRLYPNIDAALVAQPKLKRWLSYLGLVTFIIVLGNFGNVDFIYFQF